MTERPLEPPESKNKCYQFDFNASISGYGIVYAEDIDQAREFINNKEYDDIIDTYNMEIEEITNIKED